MVEAEKLAASVCSSHFVGTGKHHVCSSSDFGRSKANFAPCACWRICATNSALDLHGGGNWMSTRSCRRFWGFEFSSQVQSDLFVPRVLFSAKTQDVPLCKEAALKISGRCVQVRTPSEMMTEMDDPMVLESLLPYPKDLDRGVLAARAREMQEVVLENGAFEESVVDSPASGAMEVTEQVVGMETSPPVPTHRPVGNGMSKHGDGAQTESAQEEDLALPMKPSEGGRVIELPFKSSSFSSPNSGNFNDIAGEGTAVAQKKRKNRGKNWAKKDTDDLLRAVSNTKKVCTRMEQGTDSDSYWDAIGKAVPGRTGHECRGRMDTLKRSFSTMKKYCDGQLKEFKQLKENEFLEMKVSPRLTEDWYNQIRDYCPPTPKKKSKMNAAGSSSKSTGFVPDTSTLGLQPPVLPDGIDQGEPALVASGPVTLSMEDPPAGLEFQAADPLQQQQAPLIPQNAEVAEDFFENLWASFDLGSYPSV